MFIRPLSGISKGEKSMTFIFRPRMGIIQVKNGTCATAEYVRPRVGITSFIMSFRYEFEVACPSPHGDYCNYKRILVDTTITSVPVWGLQQFYS